MLISNLIFVSGSDPTGSLKFYSGDDVLALGPTKNNSLETKLYRAGSNPVSLLFITSSGNDSKIGINTRDPKSFLDVRGNTSTEPADIVLRTAKPSDAKISAGDETGRISFVIESSSFTNGKTKTQFIRSGSSAEIFSRVIDENLNVAYGSLIFSVNSSDSPLEPKEALTIGQGSIGGYSGVGLIISGNIEISNDVPIITLKDTTTGNINARLGAPNNINSDWCNLLLNNAGTTKIQLIGQDGSISSSGDLTANNGSFSGDLTVEGDIIAQNYIVSSSVTYMTQSFSSGSTIFGDTLDDTHQFTGSVDITGSLTAAGINYPTTDGDNGDTLITDGAGNLSFTRTTVYANVKNVSGGELIKGYPVHVTGTAGNTSEVIAASASNAATMPAHFILNETLADDAEGLAIAVGYINGVNTIGFNEGDTVYVAADGGYTNVKPTGSNLIQNLGIVDKVAENGSGFILGAGRSNDVPNLLDNQIFFGSGSNQSHQIHISGALDTTTVNNITADGTIRARVKSFDIPHPTRKGKRLVYGALEGPEHGIYCRGESKELKAKLPPEWRAMIDKKGITVQITPIGDWQPLYFKKLESNWLYFGCGDNRENVHFYWEIKGERTDVPSLETVQ